MAHSSIRVGIKRRITLPDIKGLEIGKHIGCRTLSNGLTIIIPDHVDCSAIDWPQAVAELIGRTLETPMSATASAHVSVAPGTEGPLDVVTHAAPEVPDEPQIQKNYLTYYAYRSPVLWIANGNPDVLFCLYRIYSPSSRLVTSVYIPARIELAAMRDEDKTARDAERKRCRGLLKAAVGASKSVQNDLLNKHKQPDEFQLIMVTRDRANGIADRNGNTVPSPILAKITKDDEYNDRGLRKYHSVDDLRVIMAHLSGITF